MSVLRTMHFETVYSRIAVQVSNSLYFIKYLPPPANNVMFSSPFVCLSVCFSAGWRGINIRWEGGPRKKPLDFGGNPDHVTLGTGGWGGGRDILLRNVRYVLPGFVCFVTFVVTILRVQLPWAEVFKYHSSFKISFSVQIESTPVTRFGM